MSCHAPWSRLVARRERNKVNSKVAFESELTNIRKVSCEADFSGSLRDHLYEREEMLRGYEQRILLYFRQMACCLCDEIIASYRIYMKDIRSREVDLLLGFGG
jgi:hypothetical protein